MEEIIIEERKQDFIREVDKKSGEKIDSCFQCGRCSGSCPVASFMDWTPRQINQLIKLGEKDLVLSANTIWVCASCITCTVRCPREIDLAKVMDTLRVIAIKEKVAPKIKEVPLFHNIFLKSVKKEGRVNEVTLMTEFNIRKGSYIKNIPSFLNMATYLGPKMLKSGKINPFKLIFSKKIKDEKKIKEIFDKGEKIV